MGERSKASKVGDYDVYLAESLGQGGFGVVYKARNSRSRTLVAAKSIAIKNDAVAEAAVREIKNMQHVSMDNLARLLDFSFGKNSFWLFVEFCNMGDLDHYFLRHNPDQTVKVHFMVQMAAAVRYLHSKAMVHRDIKPGNVLINFSEQDKFPMVKIADFGLAKVVDTYTGLSQIARLQFSTRGGTMAFMAPEFFNSKAKCDQAVDLFALGLSFFAMVCYRKDERLLIPSEERGILSPMGQDMHNMNKYGKAEEALNHHKKMIPIKGVGLEKQIREMVQNMVCFKSDDRWTATVVEEKIKAVYEAVKDKLPEPPKRPRDVGGSEGTTTESTVDDDDTCGERGFAQMLESLYEKIRDRKTQANAPEKTMDSDLPFMGMLDMLLKLQLHAGDEDGKKEGFGFTVGEKVVIREDITLEKMKKMQKNHGEWTDRLLPYMGKEGKVDRIIRNIVRVKFQDEQTYFSIGKTDKIIYYYYYAVALMDAAAFFKSPWLYVAVLLVIVVVAWLHICYCCWKSNRVHRHPEHIPSSNDTRH